jgi:hypothetical protein
MEMLGRRVIPRDNINPTDGERVVLGVVISDWRYLPESDRYVAFPGNAARATGAVALGDVQL